MKKFLVPFLFLAACWTVVGALVVVGIQQNYRSAANDPQIQDVEDLTTALNAGQETQLLQYLQPDGTDVSSSLSTFIALYDSKGNALGSNVTLNGATPIIPSGAFAYVDKHGQDRFTWQPKSGQSFAVVVGKSTTTGDYIAAGRSLRQVEKRINTLYGIAAVAWTLLLLITLLGCYTIVEGCPCPRCMKKRGPAESVAHNHNHHGEHHHEHHIEGSEEGK